MSSDDKTRGKSDLPRVVDAFLLLAGEVGSRWVYCRAVGAGPSWVDEGCQVGTGLSGWLLRPARPERPGVLLLTDGTILASRTIVPSEEQDPDEVEPGVLSYRVDGAVSPHNEGITLDNELAGDVPEEIVDLVLGVAIPMRRMITALESYAKASGEALTPAFTAELWKLMQRTGLAARLRDALEEALR